MYFLILPLLATDPPEEHIQTQITSLERVSLRKNHVVTCGSRLSRASTEVRNVPPRVGMRHGLASGRVGRHHEAAEHGDGMGVGAIHDKEHAVHAPPRFRVARGRGHV